MKRLTQLTLAAALGASLLPGAALADGNGHGKWKNDRGHAERNYKGCPPGLAKKNNGCRPPGLAKKSYRHDDERDDAWRDADHHWRRGDRIIGDYVLIRDPNRYGLNDNRTYWRSNGYVYQVDRQTGEVLALIGLARSILGN
ncbi:excinuclease ABC subunit A [Thioclava sp.]|uniref:excinuclease ABC subunit A n=1 Tax=Thioclava sp. TaxID=1933450 RepID=UPI0032426C5A